MNIIRKSTGTVALSRVKLEQTLQHVHPLLENGTQNESVLNVVVTVQVAQRLQIQQRKKLFNIPVIFVTYAALPQRRIKVVLVKEFKDSKSVIFW